VPSSALYKGWVAHQRFLPKPHGFRYQVFMLWLNLDELPTVFAGCRWWSYLTPNVAWFKRSDYFGDPQRSLKEEIAQLVNKATGHAPRGGYTIMLTNLRYFGHCFNPVTFYYCFEPDGQTLQAIVSHITNTPWGEDYAYVHDMSQQHATKATTATAICMCLSCTRIFMCRHLCQWTLSMTGHLNTTATNYWCT
jgi:uncharacterized protein